MYIAFAGANTHGLTRATEVYDVWPECDCQVHSHINQASKKIYPSIITEVKRLLDLHEGAQVKTTGISFGATMATMTGMQLIKDGIPVTMINFGMGRVGDDNFAKFSSQVFPDQYRVVKDRDMVVQGTFMWQTWMGFRFAPTEIFIDRDYNLRQCDASGEDPTCAGQYKWK